MKLIGRSMKLKNTLILFGISCFSFAAFGSSTGFSKVTQLHMNRDTGQLVFIATDSATQEMISCHTRTTWSYVLPLENELDKAMYSAILAAYVAGKKLSLSVQAIAITSKAISRRLGA